MNWSGMASVRRRDREKMFRRSIRMIRVRAEAGKNIRSAAERSNTGERSGSCLMGQGLSLLLFGIGNGIKS